MSVIEKHDFAHSKPRKMKESCGMKTSFSFLSLTSSVLLGIFLLNSCTEKEEGIKPKYRDLTEAIYSTAIIQPRDVYTIYAQANGIIESSVLTEGKQVKKGDFLFKIKNTQARINQETERLRYNLAQESYSGETTQLRELHNEIENAQMAYRNDSILYERRKRLWAKEVTSRQQLEAAQLKFKTSKNIKNALIQKYQRLELELSNQLKLAKNNYTIRSLQEEDYTSNALMHGTVYEVYKEMGETVTSQIPIGIIGSTNDFILLLQIDEVDIQSIFVGQRLITKLDAYPDQRFEAKITSIYPRKNERSQTFTIEAEFLQSPSNLYFGLSGEANIIVAQKTDVLCLPSHYIVDNNKVNTKEGLKEVEIGIRSLQYVEILSGIDTSTVVLQRD